MIDPGLLARQTLERSSEALFWTDAEGHILYANPTAAHLLGWILEELTRMTVFQITPDLEVPMWKQLLKDVHHHGSVDLELTHLTQKGHLIPVDFTMTRISLGDPDCYCV